MAFIPPFQGVWDNYALNDTVLRAVGVRLEWEWYDDRDALIKNVFSQLITNSSGYEGYEPLDMTQPINIKGNPQYNAVDVVESIHAGMDSVTKTCPDDHLDLYVGALVLWDSELCFVNVVASNEPPTISGIATGDDDDHH